jgi:replicative DNA helicase
MECNISRIPTAIDAERLVLGAIIVLPDCAADVFRRVKAQDFFDPACCAVYMAMVEQHARGLAVDPPMLVADLKTHPLFDDGSAAGFLLGLAQGVATIANLDHYVRLILDASSKRQLLDIVEAVRVTARNGQPADAVIRKLLADIRELRCCDSHNSDLIRASDGIPEPVEWLWPNRIALG